MKRIYLLLIIPIAVWSQTYTINWQANKAQEIGNLYNLTLPSIADSSAYYDSEDLVHFYKKDDRITAKSYTLTNPILTPITNLGDLRKDAIPEEIWFDARQVSQGNKRIGFVDMIPLVRKNNVVYRVEGFTLVPNQTKNSNGLRTPLFNNTSSVLRRGEWYKISVEKTGIHRLDYSFFTQNNLPTDFNPTNIRIFGNGGAMLPEAAGDFRYGSLQENAIEVVDGGDGSFDAGDYVLFYAQGPHDFVRSVNLQNTRHAYNIYEEKAYYFLNFDGGPGKRVQGQNLSGTPTETFTNYDDYQFFENDSLNLYNVGRQWVGNTFNLEPTRTFSFDAHALDTSSPVFFDYRLVSAFALQNTVNISNSAGTIANFTVNYGSQADAGRFVQHQGSSSLSTSNLDVTISVDNAANPGGRVHMDWLRVKYKQNLRFNGTQMRFRQLRNLNDGELYAFQFNSAPMEQVWNISDRTNAQRVSPTNNAFLYRSSSPHFRNEFIAFNAAAAYEATFESRVNNQNIRSLNNIEYVVISHPLFLAEANRLANYHQQTGKTVAVVTPEQVYNEYSSGSQDITGIRDFLSHLYTKGNLRYVLLFGDSSFDFKDRIDINNNFIPSYQSFSSTDYIRSFVTDDYFAILDSELTNTTSEGILLSSNQLDVAVGRIPARNLADAKVMVDKTLAYYNTPESFGDWRTKIHLVVDDDDPNNPFHQPIEQNTVGFFDSELPFYTVRKLYLDAFTPSASSGGQRYPNVADEINLAVETGTLFLNYFGHGGFNGWTQERVLTNQDVKDYDNFRNVNFKRLPVVMTITCDFAIWDAPQLESGGEIYLQNPNGGAALMLTTSRAIGVSYGVSFNPMVVEHIFEQEGDQYVSVAEGLRRAKVEFGNNSNNYSVNILGDPALSMARPPLSVRLTTINGEDAATFDGTLRALDFVTMEGEVLNANQNLFSSFNGEVTATLFDKPVNKRTRNNDGNLGTMEYTEQINAIFRGKTAVENGRFKLEFFIPKDINYTVGNGKLLLYADNKQTDAVSAINTIKIGDQNPDGSNDNTGPVIGLYMNNLNFVDGGITDRDPYILACLVDDTGINATGIGIGHDITGVLNEDLEGTLVFNNYYDGGDNSPCINPNYADYQKGRVLFHLRDLELGDYQLRFKAWDINNNSGTETLNFTVLEDGSQQLFINRLLNWPNPFTNQTYFQFEHNCDAQLEVLIQIFTVTGKIVKTIQQEVSSAPFQEGYRTGRFEIPWDGLDDFGNKIGRGVYIYKATVRGVDANTCAGSAQEIEKLVILK